MPILIFNEITIFLCFITFIINLHNCLYIFEYFVICIITRLLSYCHLYLCYFLWCEGFPLALLCFTCRSCCLFPSCVYYLDFKLKPFPSSLIILSRNIFLSARYLCLTNTRAHIVMQISNVYACICLWNKIYTYI